MKIYKGGYNTLEINVQEGQDGFHFPSEDIPSIKSLLKKVDKPVLIKFIVDSQSGIQENIVLFNVNKYSAGVFLTGLGIGSNGDVGYYILFYTFESDTLEMGFTTI